MRKSGAVDAEFGVFATEISRSSRIGFYDSERFDGCL